MTALWQLYVIYSVLMAFATNCMSGVGSQTLVVNWFSQRRATALGISQMGASFGGMVLGPLAAVLFADHGWRNVYLGFGIATLALAPVLAWLTVGRPEEHGERPYGFEPSATGSPGSVGSSSPVLTARDAVRLPTLWLLARRKLRGRIPIHAGSGPGLSPRDPSLLVSTLVFGFSCTRKAKDGMIWFIAHADTV